MAYVALLTRGKVDDERERRAVDFTKVFKCCAWAIAVNDADYVMVEISELCSTGCMQRYLRLLEVWRNTRQQG